LWNRSRTELNTLINQKSVEGLPINRRDFSRFAQLTPGVSVVQGPDGDEITINGQKGIQIIFRLTARMPTTRFWRTTRRATPGFTISLESVKEFQVVPVGSVGPKFGPCFRRFYQQS